MRRTASIALTMLLAMSFIPAMFAQDAAPATTENKATVQAELNAEALKVLMEAKIPLVLLDARGPSDQWIPGAVPLSCEADEKAIRQALPNKDALIVTYCGGTKCPMSLKLAERLTALGYTHVIRFTGGLEAWNNAGLPLKKKETGSATRETTPMPTPMPSMPAPGSGSSHSGSGSR